MSILSSLITSKTRIRILMRLFLNPDQRAYARELTEEFGISPSQISDELQQLARAGLLKSTRNGRQIHYQANTRHALFPELHSMVKKALGMDHIIESILYRLGDLEEALLIDDYAQGRDTGIIDLVLVGEINQENLADLVRKSERYLKRKIRTLCLTRYELAQFRTMLKKRPALVLWRRTENPARKSGSAAAASSDSENNRDNAGETF
jgi:DNA-binding MarR family transcriptional regulator